MLSAWLRLSWSLRRDRKRGLWALLVPVLALVMTGCAQPVTGTLRSDQRTASSSPATVTVGPDDGGRTVDLKVGDRLIVRLDTGRRASRFLPPWTLRMPPSTVLKRIPGDPDATRVLLLADGQGTVRLILVKRASCTPPLRCPLAAAGPTSQSERMRPPLDGPTITITVHVG